MRKAKVILTFLLGAVIGVILAVGVYMYTYGDVEWETYIEEELLPNAVIALTSVGALCGAALPIINRVNGTLVSFDKATDDVQKTVASDERIVAEVSAYRQEIREAVSEIRSIKEEISDRIAPVETSARNIERIVHIGFGNNKELVEGGFAAAIEEVGADDGNKGKEE